MGGPSSTHKKASATLKCGTGWLNINAATGESWDRKLLSTSAFPVLATPIVLGLLLRDLSAALWVLLINLGSIWPHLTNTGLTLKIITLTVRMLCGTLFIFVTTLFTD